MGSLQCNVRVDPRGSKRLDRGPLSKRHLVNAVVAHCGPRAMHTYPCQGGLGYGSERRIWSGFEYAMGFVRGLA